MGKQPVPPGSRCSSRGIEGGSRGGPGGEGELNSDLIAFEVLAGALLVWDQQQSDLGVSPEPGWRSPSCLATPPSSLWDEGWDLRCHQPLCPQPLRFYFLPSVGVRRSELDPSSLAPAMMGWRQALRCPHTPAAPARSPSSLPTPPGRCECSSAELLLYPTSQLSFDPTRGRGWQVSNTSVPIPSPLL